MASNSPTQAKGLLPIAFSGQFHIVSILIPRSPRRDGQPMAPMQTLCTGSTLLLSHHIFPANPSNHQGHRCVPRSNMPLLPEPPRRLRFLILLYPNPLQPSHLHILRLLESFWSFRLSAPTTTPCPIAELAHSWQPRGPSVCRRPCSRKDPSF